ncbi:MAG: DUF4157 domain-containing protein [Kofleriaceae bacterium]
MARTPEHRPELHDPTQHAAQEAEVEQDSSAARGVSLAGLRQIQQKAHGGAAGDVHAAAARGVESPTTALPHADKIQAAFGGHDVSHIQAHVGGNTANEMGANAYAAGNHVVFDRQPDLHTAAHEAAHVVQQAKGVNLYGGVGEAGDAHERHADAVADRVVAGQSAADLLGAPSAGGAAGGAVQLDTGSAKVTKENDKLAAAPAADRKQAHGDADVASAQAMGSSILRVASRLMAFVALYDKKKDEKPKDEAGFARITQDVAHEAKGCNSDVDSLAMFLSGFETRNSGDADKDGHISGTHQIFADKMRQFKFAWLRYREAFFKARTFVNSHQGAWDAADIDGAPWPDTVGGMFKAFGLTLDETQAQAVEQKDVGAATSEDLIANVGAARKGAHALRMEAKDGADSDRKADTTHVVIHIGEVVRALDQLDPQHLKAHKGILKDLVEELEALEPALEARPELKNQLFGSAGSTPYRITKIKAAYKAAGGR